MGREWKPGDVARTLSGGTIARTATDRWILLDDGRPIDWEDDSRISHSLIVIDPEDRAQVAELWTTYAKSTGGFNNMQAALRSLIEPPRPDEPTGLGAVVEDADGLTWVLYTHPDSTCPWVCAEVSADWADIAAVRVLSKGVS